MGIIWTILIGFVVGALAKLLVPGKQGGGFILTTLLGIAGSFVGDWIFGMLGLGSGFIGSIIGAVLLVLLVQAISKRSA